MIVYRGSKTAQYWEATRGASILLEAPVTEDLSDDPFVKSLVKKFNYRSQTWEIVGKVWHMIMDWRSSSPKTAGIRLGLNREAGLSLLETRFDKPEAEFCLALVDAIDITFETAFRELRKDMIWKQRLKEADNWLLELSYAEQVAQWQEADPERASAIIRARKSGKSLRQLFPPQAANFEKGFIWDEVKDAVEVLAGLVNFSFCDVEKPDCDLSCFMLTNSRHFVIDWANQPLASFVHSVDRLKAVGKEFSLAQRKLADVRHYQSVNTEPEHSQIQFCDSFIDSNQREVVELVGKDSPYYMGCGAAKPQSGSKTVIVISLIDWLAEMLRSQRGIIEKF